VSATNRGAKRVESDFYATPAWCVRAILPHLPVGGSVLEPCAGDGAIVDVLCGPGGVSDRDLVDAMESDKARAEALIARGVACWHGDALSDEARVLWDMPHALCLGNPPYGLALEFVQRAVSAQRPHGGTTAMLLRLGFLAGQRRVAWHRANSCDVYVLPKRPSFTGRGTDASDYGWMVYGPGRGGRLFWLNTEDA
jgi:hypothetical protein